MDSCLVYYLICKPISKSVSPSVSCVVQHAGQFLFGVCSFFYLPVHLSPSSTIIPHVLLSFCVDIFPTLCPHLDVCLPLWHLPSSYMFNTFSWILCFHSFIGHVHTFCYFLPCHRRYYNRCILTVNSRGRVLGVTFMEG